MNKKDLLIDGKKSNQNYFILAHGAGAPMDSDWMNQIVEKLVQRDITVVRFEFPYMNERRLNGKKRPPNTKKVLLQTWIDVMNLFKDKNLYIGGKSMGGRMATLLEDLSMVKGIICLGFPFHAPGKEPKDRIAHLEEFKKKTLILQGTRDTMGNKEEVLEYNLSKKIKIHWLEDGDHSLKPRVKSGYTLEQHLDEAVKEIQKFIK